MPAPGVLTSDDPDIRFQASVGLSRLEEGLNNAIKAAAAAVEKDPSLPARAHSLANAYLAYLSSGLLDATGRVHYARLAIQALERSESLAPAQSTAVDRARCCLLARDYAGCLSVLRRAADVPERGAEAALLRMEALHALGRLGELRDAAKSAQSFARDDPMQQALVTWWATAP